jgi:hypothetical protein
MLFVVLTVYFGLKSINIIFMTMDNYNNAAGFAGNRGNPSFTVSVNSPAAPTALWLHQDILTEGLTAFIETRNNYSNEHLFGFSSPNIQPAATIKNKLQHFTLQNLNMLNHPLRFFLRSFSKLSEMACVNQTDIVPDLRDAATLPDDKDNQNGTGTELKDRGEYDNLSISYSISMSVNDQETARILQTSYQTRIDTASSSDVCTSLKSQGLCHSGSATAKKL